jgi:phage repressor protein C with HTH and peptisase S24 domain
MQINTVDKMGINERIAQIIEYLAISKYRFAQMSGVSESVLLNITKGKNKPSFDVIHRILECFNQISAEWLLTGEGNMLKRDFVDKQIEKNYSVSESIFDYDSSDAIERPILDPAISKQEISEIMNLTALRGADSFVSMKGNSMMPKYLPGDILICRSLPKSTFIQWNKVYVLETEQGLLIKRIKKGNSDNTYMLISENEEFEPFEIKIADILRIGMVLCVIHKE